MVRRILPLVLTVCMLLPSAALGKGAKKMKTMSVTSPAFTDRGEIPVPYTCDGNNISPPLAFSGIPAGANSLALVVDDPDAPVGTWIHWVAWNIPPQTRDIKENSVPKHATQGLNSWKRNSYGGPCPPSGTHRYYFRLYALDTTLSLAASATRVDLEKAMEGHLLAKGELMGTYRRR
jgi:Raf kinase inhibitor-like YbhB/YbcL family protein